MGLDGAHLHSFLEIWLKLPVFSVTHCKPGSCRLQSWASTFWVSFSWRATVSPGGFPEQRDFPYPHRSGARTHGLRSRSRKIRDQRSVIESVRAASFFLSSYNLIRNEARSYWEGVPMLLAVDSISATALDGNDWSNGGEGGEEETTSHEEGKIENRFLPLIIISLYLTESGNWYSLIFDFLIRSKKLENWYLIMSELHE